MTISQILMLAAFSALLSAGQILFKFTAIRINGLDGTALIRHLISDYYFISALATYGLSTLVWVLILRQVPLSRAYPFASLALIIVPVASVFFFNETLGIKYFIGLALVILGMLVLSS
ncbi:multidrug transporter EmrE-like cation transporter [Azospirillum sp. OGB3]|uniref:4-amino-4-deoxy-L-arabinose-phospho-UDP flippase n=1 Tax=Azospirillum sp. OGB3 TaxID=2587012 RepID=UPI0016057B77|nr:4-amino-4-deoxy-L-arabinose-phospho-UDP flippase [Azospirillum sp. OGB3]MBB3268188.1 multidrug transporter EmrE-like cation transporter [Azospirillum sp. OGB3]